MAGADPSRAQAGHRPPHADGVDDLQPMIRAIGADLLLYKSLFQGADFARMGAAQAREDIAEELLRMSVETEKEWRGTVQALRLWDRMPAGSDLHETLAKLQDRTIQDLLTLKENTTEAFLLVGMRAPTDELRRAFVHLADLDRAHADTLRALLGTHRVHHRLVEDAPPRPGVALGAHDRRMPDASLARSLEQVLAELRRDGQMPVRIVLSPVALRHARDEGIIGPQDGTLFELPVDVDFGWRGECFAVRTRDQASLAEIIAARSKPD